jgi:two-component system sensor histidine kinase KdpD
MQTLRLAESLGAQTATITASGSSHAAAELVSYARARNINRIIVGKTLHSPLREAWLMLSGRGSFIRDLIRASGEIEVTVLSGEADADPALAPAPVSGDTQVAAEAPRQPVGRTVRSYLASLGLVAGCTGISALLFQRLDLANVVMLYLAGVVVAAMWLGRGPAVVATVLGVAAFDFVFVPPHLTFAVSDVQYLITFAVMLFVGVLISHLAARLRAMAESARDRERRTASLYAMARELAAAQSLTQVYTVATQHLAAAFEADVILAAASPAAGEGVDVLSSAGGTPDWLDAPGSPDRSVARWVLDHGRTAGFGTRTLPAAAGRFIPLATPQGGQGRLGVIGLRPRSPDAASRMLSADRLLLLDTFAGQIAAAVERIGLIDSRQSARLEVETERLRSALLSSVSHDLRTPLTAIAGAASTLRESGEQLEPATRAELVDSIVTESQRLNELIANLVFATRLESGAIELARQWTTIEDIVGSGLAAHRDALSRRTVRILGLSGLPMVNVDNAMLPMVIHNLVENALRYSPAGSPITITGWAADNTITLKIADEGPGLAEGELARVFQRFYRGRTARTPESASARGGMGLGLTICQGIIRAHGGRIWAEPNTPAGAAFLFSLPLTEPQPDLAAEAAEPVSSLAASAAAAPTAGGRA